MPAATRSWTVERPSFGLGFAVLGTLFAVLGLFVLQWDVDADWFDVRRTMSYNSDQYSVVSQAYSRVLYLPILLAAVITGLSATAGRLAARVGSAVGGVAIGGWLIGMLIWVETGAVGSSATRQGALPALVVLALVGVGCLVLGVGALFDDRAVLARILAAVVAGLGLVVQVYVSYDVLIDQSAGSWAPAVGYGFLALAPALPYRRIERTG